MITYRLLSPLLIGLFLYAGCTSNQAHQVEPQMIRLQVKAKNPTRLLDYYFSAYLSPDGGDPFKEGLVVEKDGDFFLSRDRLMEVAPFAVPYLDSLRGGRSALSWEALRTFVHKTYYAARPLPPDLDHLRQEVPYGRNKDWFVVDIHAVFTAALRRIYVPVRAMRSALEHYQENNRRLIYPVGTTIVAEHLMDDTLAEVTAIRKRPDGEWDFFAYDASGKLTPRTHTPPRSLKIPVQCAGCHLGSRLFEPEKSFPKPAPPGPHGPRAIYVDEDMKNPTVVRFFQEHAKRSDTVLGIYNTLFVSKLLALRAKGELPPEDQQLLEKLGL